MRCTVEKDDLQKTLTAVSRVLPKSSPLPHLSSFRLEAAGDRLFVSGTDLETSLRISVLAEILEEGALLVPRLLLDSVKELPKGKLEIVSENVSLVVTYGLGGEIRLNGFPPENYPETPVPGELSSTVRISAERFREIVDAVGYAAAATAEEATGRLIFTAIVLDFKEDGLWAVATNTHRLAAYHLDGAFEHRGRAIIPAAKLYDLARLAEGEVVVRFDGVNAFFEMAGMQAWVRMLNGQYPNYENILNHGQPTGAVTFRKDALLASLARAMQIVDKEKLYITIDFKAAGRMEIASGSELGTMREQVPIVRIDGDVQAFCLNPRYLREALGAIKEEQVTLLYFGPRQPLVLKPNDHYTALVLPVRFAGAEAA